MNIFVQNLESQMKRILTSGRKFNIPNTFNYFRFKSKHVGRQPYLEGRMVYLQLVKLLFYKVAFQKRRIIYFQTP